MLDLGNADPVSRGNAPQRLSALDFVDERAIRVGGGSDDRLDDGRGCAGLQGVGKAGSVEQICPITSAAGPGLHGLSRKEYPAGCQKQETQKGC